MIDQEWKPPTGHFQIRASSYGEDDPLFDWAMSVDWATADGYGVLTDLHGRGKTFDEAFRQAIEEGRARMRYFDALRAGEPEDARVILIPPY